MNSDVASLSRYTFTRGLASTEGKPLDVVGAFDSIPIDVKTADGPLPGTREARETLLLPPYQRAVTLNSPNANERKISWPLTPSYTITKIKSHGSSRRLPVTPLRRRNSRRNSHRSHRSRRRSPLLPVTYLRRRSSRRNSRNSRRRSRRLPVTYLRRRSRLLPVTYLRRRNSSRNSPLLPVTYLRRRNSRRNGRRLPVTYLRRRNSRRLPVSCRRINRSCFRRLNPASHRYLIQRGGMVRGKLPGRF